MASVNIYNCMIMSGIFLLHYVFSYPYVNETPVNYVRNYMGKLKECQNGLSQGFKESVNAYKLASHAFKTLHISDKLNEYAMEYYLLFNSSLRSDNVDSIEGYCKKNLKTEKEKNNCYETILEVFKKAKQNSAKTSHGVANMKFEGNNAQHSVIVAFYFLTENSIKNFENDMLSDYFQNICDNFNLYFEENDPQNSVKLPTRFCVEKALQKIPEQYWVKESKVFDEGSSSNTT